MLQQELRLIIDDFVAEHSDMALERLDGEEVEFDRMREALQSMPFLASRKLVVFRNASANKQFLEQAESLLSELSESTEVIFVETKLDKRTAYYKYLKRHAAITDCQELDTPQLAKWLARVVKEQGGQLSISDATYLIERVGANQLLLNSELTKLLSYDVTITRSTIDMLTERTPQSTIFELLDAALAGRTKRALDLYAEQRAMRIEPQQILALLIWQLHILSLVKSAGTRSVDEIARETKLKPFLVRKSQGIVGQMTMAQLKVLVHEVYTLDIGLKSESIDADDALQNLIVKLGH